LYESDFLGNFDGHGLGYFSIQPDEKMFYPSGKVVLRTGTTTLSHCIAGAGN
jgi:hypothetical protein